jgi:hypothetical protein
MIVKLDPSESPARRLAELLPGTLELIAPERVGELAQHFHDLTLQVEDERRWVWNIRPEEGMITVSFRAIEVLWAVSYSYWVFYSKVIIGAKPQGQEVDLRTDPEVSMAMDLLGWAVHASSSGQSWPEGVPSLAANPVAGSFEYAAQQLCLGAAGLLLHHELAHKYLRHSSPRVKDASWVLDAERDADRAAADWILDRSTCPEAQFTFRALCASVALLMLTAFSIHAGRYDGLEHPRTFDRLFHTLSNYLSPEDNEIWRFVSAILYLHMQSMKILPPEETYDNFYEFVNACVDKLAAVAEGQANA